MEHAITPEILTTLFGDENTTVYFHENWNFSSKKRIDSLVGEELQSQKYWFCWILPRPQVPMVHTPAIAERKCAFFEICTFLRSAQVGRRLHQACCTRRSNNCENSQQTPVAALVQNVWIWAQLFWIFRSQNRSQLRPDVLPCLLPEETGRLKQRSTGYNVHHFTLLL